METAPLDSQDELTALRALVAEQAAKLESQEAEVIKRDSIIGLLRAQLELLRHRQHGASSEKIDRKIEQFELMLEEIEASRAEAELRAGKTPLPDLDDAPDKPKRKPLPDGLATEELIYEAPCNCPTCGGTSFLKAPDRVVQVLEHVPASVKIVRHVEKRMICRECDTTVAGEMPTLPIERGKPGPGLLAHIMVSKFDDHIPLYRLSEMYDRLGIDISRSVMADWVGRVSALLTPIILLIRAHIAALDRIHTDDTPVDVLDPGRGKTKTGRVWVYVFDGSGYQSATPAAIAYYYSPDRKGAHPADHLASFSGVMHADGYGGYKKLYGNQIVEAACMAHVRRKFHDVIKLKSSPIAEEALSRIGALYDIENRIRGMSADERRTLRQHHARPVLDELKAWIEATLSTLPQKQKLAEAMRYALSRWAALSVYIDDGRVEIDNNIAERAMRPLGIGRKNWMFAGSDKGGERIANILTIIETGKLHGHNPEVYLTDVLTRIRDHPKDRLEDLLPWNWASAKARHEAV
ncbi:putative insertion sequence transposase protein [Agrobacterium sp. ATCC 31749]|uniref:IS66 family transposase n=1 Tax=unclassified Agrobacterium TaxID=2632611 RepID=UPI00020DB3FF|nr:MULTISPECIES: IS66 family transposase [unclassified Agrobacterium]EGL63102.1 putative insertion sequence transposase protein [Agrobacterium sp. ATCC 31749]QKW96839.1 IS66 family transposase [Agrobacterium sp. CGMCC 11546]QKW99409.1 IS66 family transposase [Agrobacterium sp. CGMCC 11546]QKX00506.1 IS66 family transposase [Agrobacterium sp. CGMCC 11546]